MTQSVLGRQLKGGTVSVQGVGAAACEEVHILGG